LKVASSRYGHRILQKIAIAKPRSLNEDWEYLSSPIMVLTSRMHAGLMALSGGIPTIFLQPRDDTKVLDVLSTIGVNEEEFIVDAFSEKNFSEELTNRITYMINNYENIVYALNRAVEKAALSAEVPFRVLRDILT